MKASRAFGSDSWRSKKDLASVLVRLLVLCVLSYFAILYHPISSTSTPITIKSLSSELHGHDLRVSVAVTNGSSQARVVKVAWYLSYPDDTTPWLTGFFASSWQSRIVGPSSTMVFQSQVIEAMPTGVYQLSAYLHGPGKTNPVQYDQATSSTMVHVVDNSELIRATTHGSAFVSRVTIPIGSKVTGSLLNVKADVSLRYPASVRPLVSLTWDLVAKNTVQSNSWDYAPTQIGGITYRNISPTSRIDISSRAIGVPGRTYALRLRVFIGKRLSDTVIVPSTDFVGGGSSPTLIRTFYPPANIPLVITSLNLPAPWRPGLSSTVSVTVTNTTDRLATGQLILQVGHVGDPTPWKDPSFTFSLVTFAVPPRSTEVVRDAGSPTMKSGEYELGVYVHYESPNGTFQPGDQVFARQHVIVDGTT